MKLKPHLALLLAAASLPGCSLLGFGEDEEPLGPTTQVAFSLYASPSVNPNPNTPQAEADATVHTPSVATPIGVDGAGQALYQINLTGSDQLDLIDKLSILLNQLQSGGSGDAPARLAEGIPFDPSLQIPKADGTPATPTLSRIPDLEALARRTYDVPLVPNTLDDRAPAWLDAATDAWQHAGTAPAESAASPAPEAVATPITFKILQLKDDSLFLNADLDLLTQNLKKALGKTYLEDDDYILLPGQFKFIDYADIHEDTRYLAVFANFHDQNGATWKQVLRLEPNGHKYALLVTLHDNAVAITEERYRQPKPRPMK
ncbi:type VI secretion system lipoprotein TssJ [Pseudomonas parafulva]|uniref:type VI secretion system lipoprotein TssJ n=2 Tax=Pseudomonas TaxID=286 RepID=UPI0018DA137D|nr:MULTISPECIES: type VI secretion system lipoprotein TssJ [Pseudomonas]MBH3346430.1 type VI secretion system lipoprotein TssJ [Pseudomonas parafulva]MEC4024754.1 type VI secretion system lipoprotein TssJ [Pseudomonas fulva]